MIFLPITASQCSARVEVIIRRETALAFLRSVARRSNKCVHVRWKANTNCTSVKLTKILQVINKRTLQKYITLHTHLSKRKAIIASGSGAEHTNQKSDLPASWTVPLPGFCSQGPFQCSRKAIISIFLVRVFITMIKHYDQEQLGKEWVEINP